MSKKDWTREELVDFLKDMTAVTVPVNIRIEGKQKIIDLTMAEELMKKAKIISLGNCGCRDKMKHCDSPLDVCISLDKEAEDLIKKGRAKPVSILKAMDALKRSHEAGLVHLAFTNKGDAQPFIICSCCSCCCQALSGLLRFNIPDAVFMSDHVTVQNTENCTNCGTCAERCRFHARRMINEQLVFDPEKCFGCGLCVTTCPSEAISFVKRS